MSSPSSASLAPDNYSLFKRTVFGFRRPREILSALQRSVFFLIAWMGEYLATTRVFGWLVDLVVRGTTFLLTVLTPHAAADLDNEPERGRLRVVAWATALAAIIISLIGNAIFTWDSGTFVGTDPRRYYYSEDTHNLIMFALIAPAYMAAAAAMIYCALSSFSVTDRTSWQSESPGRIGPIVRLGFVLSGIVLVSGLVQVNYFNESIMGLSSMDPAALKPACRDRVFWFFEEVAGSGGAKVLRLNPAGVYYVCLLFCHMAVVATAVWFLATAMFTLYRLGWKLTPEFLARNGGAEPVHAKLKRFTLLELSAKCLALILTIHIQIWGDSCLRGNDNIRMMAMVLLALGFFVLASPRLLIEYRLLKCAAANQGSEADIEWPDLIDQRDKVTSAVVSSVHFIVQVLFLLLIGGLITIAIG